MNGALAIVYAVILWGVLLFAFELGVIEGRLCALEKRAGIECQATQGD